MILTLSITAMTLSKGDSGNIGSALLDAIYFMNMAIWPLSGIRRSGGLIPSISFGSFVFFVIIPLIHLVIWVLLLQRIIAYRYYKNKSYKRWLTAIQVKIQEPLLKPKS
jgi:hypothetical protein